MSIAHPHEGSLAAGARPASGPPPNDDAPLSAIREASLSTVWIDRDLSWIEFNRRVLAEALDERTPLLERVKFLAIFASNLDEFFMKRMAVLRETPHAGAAGGCSVRSASASSRCCGRQADYFLSASSRSCRGMASTCGGGASSTAGAAARRLGDYFDTQVSPALTPLVIHPAQPFPFFSNLSLSLAFVLHDDRSGESVDARVKVPSELPQWVPLFGRCRRGRARVRPPARSDPGERAQALSGHAADRAHAVSADARRRGGDERRCRSGPAGTGPRADPAAALRAGRAAGIRRQCRRAVCGRCCRQRFGLTAQTCTSLPASSTTRACSRSRA